MPELPEGVVSLPVVRFGRDGRRERLSACVLPEHRLRICVNASAVTELICTPCHLRELAAGRLWVTGWLARAGDASALFLTDDGSCADLRLSGAHRTVREPEKLTRAGNWEPEWVFAAAGAVPLHTPLHAATSAAHSCVLMCSGKVRGVYEDLSRHNTVDKAIGALLLSELPPEHCLLYSSARVSAGMVEQVCAAGIPVLAARGMPTENALLLARERGLTLLFRAREDSFQIMSPEQTDG